LAEATTFADADGPVEQVLPYWSFSTTTGCVANALPLAAPGTGCVLTVRLDTDAAVGIMVKLFVAAFVTPDIENPIDWDDALVS
jgi:hypothetical protein